MENRELDLNTPNIIFRAGILVIQIVFCIAAN